MRIPIQELLAAYSEEIRLRILLLLYHSEICVNCLVAILDLPQSTISRHLSILKKAGLIQSNRQGQHTYYTDRLSGNDIAHLNGKLLEDYSKNLMNQSPYNSDRLALIKQGHLCSVDCRVGIKENV